MITQWLFGEVTTCSSTVPVAKGAESDRSPGPQLEELGWSIVPGTHLRKTRPREEHNQAKIQPLETMGL